LDLETGLKTKVNADMIWTEEDKISRFVAQEGARFAVVTDEAPRSP